MKQRYDELIALIEKANYEYYTLDNPWPDTLKRGEKEPK